MHIYVGRIKFDGGRDRWKFLWHGFFAYLQVKRARGAVYSSVRREDSHTLWSLSVWESPEAMMGYRDSGSHLRVMKIAREIGAPVDFVHWQSENIPDWPSAMQRLSDH